MKSLTIFGLLVYWSVIITAPVIYNEIKLVRSDYFIKPIKKPLN